MEKNIEIEFKALLTKEQYQQIKPLFAEITPYTQVNHYFDTKEQNLYRKREMLRVRFKNNKYELTLKRMGEVGLNEYNEFIDEERYEMLKNGAYFESEILDLLAKDGYSRKMIIPTYDLKTTRYDLPYKGGLLSLDHSEYLDTEDFEIEYEVNDYNTGLEIYKEFLKPYGITYTLNCHGKRHRVIDRLEELKKAQA